MNIAKDDRYLSILKSVSKPGRYSGGEYGQIIKDKNSVKASFAFCFPDTYEIGMSNLGVRILYGVLNRDPDIRCERVYTPWTDMQEKMREHNIPLFAHESGDPVSSFDIVGFSLQYEMCYTNVLSMLSLSGIPIFASERNEEHPIIIGGGPCAYNAEPVADFFDVFNLGEGEEVLLEFTKMYIEEKEKPGYTKTEFLHKAAREIEGIYVPSFYSVTYKDDGTIEKYTPIYDDIPTKIKKRIIKDLDKVYFPENPVMPYIETVHDRIMLEVARGCIRGCRFCQAGMIYRPVREKSPDVLCRNAKCIYESSGYDEISLTSLSISDYTRIDELTDKLLEFTDPNMISLSLPSLRVDSFTKELMDKVASVRSSSLTFAPEAGTQRMRDVINKNVTEEDLMRAVGVAFEAGKSTVKLYFMMGLPTETDEDIEGIATLATHVIDKYYQMPKEKRKKAPTCTISVACLIPKPFTPFQWEAQDSLEELRRKQELLYASIKDRHVKYNHHDAYVSRLEAVFARGDRRISAAIAKAHERGFCFDAWDEYFNYEGWCEIFDECGLDMSFYANRQFGLDEVLPWDIIDIGVSKEFLIRERNNAYAGKATPSCREKCSGCGANKLGGERTCCPSNK